MEKDYDVWYTTVFLLIEDNLSVLICCTCVYMERQWKDTVTASVLNHMVLDVNC